jgi:hypothetical protein
MWSPSAEFAPSVLRLTVSGRFPASAAFVGSSPREDNKQNTSPWNIGLLAGIVGGALLLILLVAVLIWRLLRRPGNSATSSLLLDMQMQHLDSREDIDFGAMAYDTNPVEEPPTDVNVVEPDESLTSVKSLVDDFL